MVSGQEAPSGASLRNATVIAPVQLSASSVINVISGAGTSPMQATAIGAGLDAVGSMISSMVNICVTKIELPQASVTL